MRFSADLEARRRRLHHPRRQAGERAVRLMHDDKLDAAALEPSSDLHGFAEPGMEPVCDPALSGLFVGSMSCD